MVIKVGCIELELCLCVQRLQNQIESGEEHNKEFVGGRSSRQGMRSVMPRLKKHGAGGGQLLALLSSRLVDAKYAVVSLCTHCCQMNYLQVPLNNLRSL